MRVIYRKFMNGQRGNYPFRKGFYMKRVSPWISHRRTCGIFGKMPQYHERL